MNIFNRKTLFITLEIDTFIQITNLLDYENIDYTYNITNRTGVKFKTFEIDVNSIFHFYVHKNDYEKSCVALKSILSK